MSGREISSSAELGALERGTVLASPNYTDAFSIVGQHPIRGVVYGWQLMNCATGAKFSPTELPDLFPVRVVYEHQWANSTTSNETSN